MPGIFFTPDEPVVERGEQRLANVGDRDDGLHRGVVLGTCVQEFPHTRKQFVRLQIFGWLRFPLFHRPRVARLSVLAPPHHSACFPAPHQEPEGRRGFREEMPERAK